MNKWQVLMEFIKEQAEEFDLHIWYSEELEWCFISDHRGKRYKITIKNTIDEVRELIQKIKHREVIGVSEFTHIKHA
jgi:hypothetical protein